MKITKELLIKRDACAAKVNLFERTFPHGTTITKTSLGKAVKAGLDLEWAIKNLLPQKYIYSYYASLKLLDDAHYVSVKPLDDPYYASNKLLQIKILLKYAKAEKKQ